MKASFYFSICLLFLLFACKTRTTPKKVERFITGEFWIVSSFIENGVETKENYSSYLFGFSENGSASVKISGQFDNVNGTWSLGANKNPAIIYLNFPLTTPMDTNILLITDDWLVNSMTKNEIKLSRNSSGQSTSNVTLTR